MRPESGPDTNFTNFTISRALKPEENVALPEVSAISMNASTMPWGSGAGSSPLFTMQRTPKVLSTERQREIAGLSSTKM